MDAPTWYGKLFQVTTGLTLGDLPLDQTPAALQQINLGGTWTATTEVGVQGGLQQATATANTRGYRFGVAICYGTRSTSDYILQMGPITNAELLQESPPQWQLTGLDAWALLNATYLLDPAGRASVTYTSSMQGIAVAILNAGLARNPLPIDVPIALSGTTSRTYKWWDLAYVGPLLQALTQSNGGPDIYFRPYFSDPSHVRWEARIGNPYITQGAGLPLLFDQGSNLLKALPAIDSSKLADTVWAKGSGVEAGTLLASASDLTLRNEGWPALEYTDSSQTQLIDLTALGQLAAGDLALYSRPVETWTVSVRTTGKQPLGSYGPGLFASYNINQHPLIPAGRYNHRILGLTRAEGDDAHTIGQILHVTQGVS